MELAAISLEGVGPRSGRNTREGYISLIFSVGIVISQSKWAIYWCSVGYQKRNAAMQLVQDRDGTGRVVSARDPHCPLRNWWFRACEVCALKICLSPIP